MSTSSNVNEKTTLDTIELLRVASIIIGLIWAFYLLVPLTNWHDAKVAYSYLNKLAPGAVTNVFNQAKGWFTAEVIVDVALLIFGFKGRKIFYNVNDKTCTKNEYYIYGTLGYIAFMYIVINFILELI